MGKFFAWLWGSFSLFLGRCVLIFCILPGIVLMAVAIPSYKNYMDKSHKARAEAEAAAAAQKDGATSAPQTDKCLPGMTTEQCNATRTNEQKGIPADQAASS
ncbi:hypothetical protein [Brachymonas sp.]|uniref:hypothetical protein n=1 Tax=unclassified Brachymonas TaxID=2621329 RepID=UPI0035B175EB